MKQRFAKVKKLQNSMKSLCDNDSSSLEDVRPFFLKSNSCKLNAKNLFIEENQKKYSKSIFKNIALKFLGDNSVDKSSDEDNLNESKDGKKPTFYTITTDESENDYQKTDKTLSKINKHKNNVKDKKINYDNIKKKNNKNEKNNDSEDDIYEKHTNKKEKKHLTLKSKQHFINFHREDSSSGKEFQKSKISRTGLNITKKLTQAKKDSIISIESDLENIIESEKKFEISKEQSLQLKFHVVKIFNKFKEACSEYELQMEHVKCKYFKKELIYQKSVSNVIQKTKNVINNLKTELDAQEKELINFYEEWNKKCKVQNLNHEDNLLKNEIEITKKIEDKEESDTSKSSSNVESIVSECDNEEIFSDTETNIMKINIDNNRENEDTIIAKFSEKSTNDSENSNRIISPILGNNKKGNRICADDDLKIIDENKRKFKEFNISSNEDIINESVDDIFKESIIENTDDVNLKDEHENEKNLKSKENEENNDNKNENSLRNDELNVEVKNKNTIEVKNIKSKSITSEKNSESVEKEESNISDEVDDEEQAKRAMLESDSETPTNEESLVEKFTKQSSTSDSFEEKDILQTKKIKFDKKKGKNKISNNTNCKNNSSDEDEIIKEEACAKNTLLESNSDDSTNPYDIKKNSNKKCDSNDDSEKLNSDNDIVLKQTKNKNKDSIKDDSKQQIFKINYIGSDRKLKMLSEVIIERLPENILKKHKNALQKSRQYLESKEFKRYKMNKLFFIHF